MLQVRATEEEEDVRYIDHDESDTKEEILSVSEYLRTLLGSDPLLSCQSGLYSSSLLEG
jgi:hypothetical protein